MKHIKWVSCWNLEMLFHSLSLSFVCRQIIHPCSFCDFFHAKDLSHIFLLIPNFPVHMLCKFAWHGDEISVQLSIWYLTNEFNCLYFDAEFRNANLLIIQSESTWSDDVDKCFRFLMVKVKFLDGPRPTTKLLRSHWTINNRLHLYIHSDANHILPSLSYCRINLQCTQSKCVQLYVFASFHQCACVESSMCTFNTN